MTVVQSVKQRLSRARRRIEVARTKGREAGHDDALLFAAQAKAAYAVVQELEDLLEEITADGINQVG